MKFQRLVLASSVALLSSACALFPPIGPVQRVVAPQSGDELSLEQLAQELSDCDVVFLGEVHDSQPAHELQLEVTRRLHELRGDLALSLEMFERDVQPELDAYLAGSTTEEAFLEASRPWKNYAEAYRPAVEYARAHDLAVLAACLPRALAARIAEEGLDAVLGEEHVPRAVTAEPGRYRELFEQAMSGHTGFEEGQLDRWFTSQCAKDDAMAEAIADHLEARAADAPLVVHWCGRFHSDYGLGTVARLRERRLDLDIAVVTTVRRPSTLRALSEDDRARGDFAFLVRR